MIPVFALATLLSAALLFVVQPMVGKMLLPILGGSSAVWTTCMLFFQAGLLAGYLYAHLLTRRVAPRWQVVVHAAVLALPLVVLPIGLGGRLPPAGGDAPIPWILATLGLIAGGPFFALASTGPLVQSWLASSRHASAKDPYFLYAASNLGSFGGLILYPAVLEPLLPLTTPGAALLPPRLSPASQSAVWAVGYVVFAAIVLAAGVLAARRPRLVETPEAAPAPSARERALWVFLAFIPSSAVLGVTQYMTSEIAAIPLLWVVPLALYLLTFVLAFSKRLAPPPVGTGVALAILAVAVAGSMTVAVHTLGRLLLPLHLACLTALGLSCHGRLAASRPAPGRLTEFYLWVALGGVLGGLFNAILAPWLFDSVVEYPLAIFLGVLARPRSFETTPLRVTWGSRLLDFAVPVALGAASVVLSFLQPEDPQGAKTSQILLQVGVPSALCLALLGWRLRFALSLGALLFVGWWQASAPFVSLHRERTFFGIHRVSRFVGPWFAVEEGGTTGPVQRREFRALIHGATRHGIQAVDPAFARTPTTYYHRDGPLGQTWAALGLDARARRIGLVGLGAGTIAAYGVPGQRMTFFEIDPAVVRIARDPRLFTFVTDSKAQIDFVVGDGRRGLAAEADGTFDVLVIDAFSSDAIPAHLLTREAVAMYLRKLAPGGVLLLHVTNQFLRLESVVSAIAGDLGAAGAIQWDAVMEPGPALEGKAGSTWAVLAPIPATLAPLRDDARWIPLPLASPDRAERRVLWTDDRSDLLSVLKHF